MKERKPTLLTLFLTVFIDLIGFGMIIPLLPFYAEKMGASGAVLGAAFSCFSIMQFIFAPIWGRLSDRVGRRPILLLGLFGSSLSYLLLAGATNIWLLIASRILAGICGANVSVAQAYIADITTRENRSKGMGMIGAAFGLGFMLGPGLAAALTIVSPQTPAFAASALCALNLVMAYFVLPESLQNKNPESSCTTSNGYFKDWTKVMNTPIVGVVVALGFLFNLSITMWETTFGLYLQRNPLFHLDQKSFGWILLYVGFWVVLIQGGLIGRLTKRLGETKLLRFGLFCLVLSVGLIPFSPSLGWVYGCMTLLAFGMGFTRPVMSGAISLLTTAEEQGLVLGVFQGISSLARILGPLIGGWLIDRSLGFPYFTAALLGFTALILTGRMKNPAK